MGKIPDKVEAENSSMYELINNWTVLDSAQKIAKSNSDNRKINES